MPQKSTIIYIKNTYIYVNEKIKTICGKNLVRERFSL